MAVEARKVVILGSTGSIGRSTIDVIIDHPGAFDVVALAGYSNVELLAEQCRRLQPKYAAIVDSSKANELEQRLSDQSIEILSGEDDLEKLASLKEADMVVNAVVGAAGLKASLAAVKAGKNLALANKESLVAGGPLFPELIKKSGARILPIDSEHSAVWQALACGNPDEVKRIILTASGGPFRDYPLDKFDTITPEMALNHPTWKMGPKITIDSATMVNKGLEIIEAVALFSFPADKVDVVIHPQSIVHSLVEFVDSSIIAQLSRPDMRLPISYALFWPERVDSAFGRLDFARMRQLNFEEPDFERFPALKLAYQAAESGGTAPAVYNAANEVAVDAFLKGALGFLWITDLIRAALNEVELVAEPTLDDILAADQRARELTTERIGKVTTC
jgi:1-deoxy-D-xylulose-5-phosphate reductoisomerase